MMMTERGSVLKKSLFSAGGLILVLLIVVLVNFIFSGVNLRWDATEDKLYSLSAGTRKILSNLNEDVVLKVFYSKSAVNVPSHIKNYAKRMLDFLTEYERNSSGKVSVEVYDPKIDSDEEEWAQKYGIKPVDLPTGDRIYFGLVAVAADQQEVIRTMDPSGEERLEYDITRMISRVQSSERPKIGIITSLPVFGQPPNPYTRQPQQPPWQFVTELKKTYEVNEISLSAQQIDLSINLLVMIHPKNLSASLQFAVDQYVLNGGNAIVFVDPFSTLDGTPGSVKASAIDRLFKAWGVRMDAGKALADYTYATRIRTRINQIENNPFWLSLQPAAFNADDIITAKLESLLLPMAGAIKNTAENKYKYEPLLRSSTNSALEEAYRVRMAAGEIRRDFKPSGKKYDLAIKLTGTFKTAFPDGKPPATKKDSKKNTDKKPAQTAQQILKQGKRPATIIIVADSDMLYDGYYVHKQKFLGFDLARIFNDNLNFLLNACEMLSGGQELINIRSRGRFEKPFTRVKKLEERAQMKWLAREQELLKKVDETNQKLAQLEQKKDASQKLIVSAEQEAEIKKFQEEKRRTRKELKIVRRNLRADIEALGTSMKMINIFLMPVLICLFGAVYAIYKRRKK